MDIGLINIGFGNFVVAKRIKAIISPNSDPTRRIIAEARERGELIDVTHGRRTRAVIIATSGHVLLTASLPQTLIDRINS